MPAYFVICVFRICVLHQYVFSGQHYINKCFVYIYFVNICFLNICFVNMRPYVLSTCVCLTYVFSIFVYICATRKLILSQQKYTLPVAYGLANKSAELLNEACKNKKNQLFKYFIIFCLIKTNKNNITYTDLYCGWVL